MPIARFPDPREAGPDGLLAVGGDLHAFTLLAAYKQGIFPWPMEGLPLVWFSPEKRAILEFKKLHVPRSLDRAWRKSGYRYTIDEAFEQVIEVCAAMPRPGQRGTWITPEMTRAYIELHERGAAHSIEVWEDDKLIGGLYGVDAGGAFAGESMFYVKSNASKLAILFLADHLMKKGLDWMDIQMLTPHMEALGAREISRDAFLKKLSRALGQAEKTSLKLF